MEWNEILLICTDDCYVDTMNYELQTYNISSNKSLTLYPCPLPFQHLSNKLNRMFRHKSLGLLTGLVVAPRLGYRIFNAAKVSHWKLCIFSSVLKLNNTNHLVDTNLHSYLYITAL